MSIGNLSFLILSHLLKKVDENFCLQPSILTAARTARFKGGGALSTDFIKCADKMFFRVLPLVCTSKARPCVLRKLQPRTAKQGDAP